jgi:hypothetical protein
MNLRLIGEYSLLEPYSVLEKTTDGSECNDQGDRMKCGPDRAFPESNIPKSKKRRGQARLYKVLV